uniref:Uncharacterized protein LOC114330513 n=1 Tax=Diabrotica virgifera virgifera TaxID=50390 RepID=A0A6P7FIC3_DIAVI
MNSNQQEKQGDNLQIILTTLLMWVNKDYEWKRASCFLTILALIQTHMVAGGVLLYYKYGTFKALVPYITTFTLTLPGSGCLYIFAFYHHKIYNILYSTIVASRQLSIQDIEFENISAKQARTMKILSLTIISLCFSAHLLFVLPTVFNDYDITLTCWFIREYCGTSFSASTLLWLLRAAVLVASLATAYPCVLMGYLQYHISLQIRWIAKYIENNFTITGNPEEHLYSFVYQQTVYSNLKRAVKLYLRISRVFDLLFQLQNATMLFLIATYILCTAGIIFFVMTVSIPYVSTKTIKFITVKNIYFCSLYKIMNK